MPPKIDSSVLAIIGGGRWGTTIATVATEMKLPLRTVRVSRSLAGVTDHVVADLGQLHRQYNVTAAIVANAARAHAETALQLIRAGIPVLVEKPMALTVGQARALVIAADSYKVKLAPLLTVLHCKYFYHFAHQARAAGEITRVTLTWLDSTEEVRESQTKTYDPGVSVAQDVMPHIWGILYSVLNLHLDCCELTDIAVAHGGRSAEYSFAHSNMSIKIEIARDAVTRRRRLELEGRNGSRFALDFTKEPGGITGPGGTVSGDPGWAARPSPIESQIREFLHLNTSDPNSFEKIMGPVTLAEKASLALRTAQMKMLSAACNSLPRRDAFYAAREILSDCFYGKQFGRPGDRAALDAWTHEHLHTLVENK
jgi:predicted dehydrogenase